MKLSNLTILAILTMLSPFTSFADSDTDAIKEALAKRHEGFSAKSIQPSPIPSLYEVYANGQMLYVSKNAEYVLVGATLVEDATKRNVTAQRLQELTKINFDTLPFQHALEIKKGNGQYKFAVFSDPDCPYCKSFEQGLDKLGLNDYTAYVFLFPLESIHKEARAKAESIWCAKDKSSAWHEWMLNEKMPEKMNCDNPIDRILQLGDRIGVEGTPTVFLSNGKKMSTPQELVDAIKNTKSIN